MTLIQSQTADSDTTVSFTSGIDSTYKLYVFKFYDVNPENEDTSFVFQGNASSQSGYNETMNTTFWRSQAAESSGTPATGYITASDQANGTDFQILMPAVGDGGDESCAGTLWLFNPSDTTYVTHFYSLLTGCIGGPSAYNAYCDGYFNTTAAITNIQFKMVADDFDAVIKMYGVG